jgi:addiction module HigA family antidote
VALGLPLAWALWSALDEQEPGALTSRELVAANLKELGLCVAEAAKAIGVTRQQLYNVINDRSAVTQEMAVRFEKAFGGGADMWLRMQAAADLAKVRPVRRRDQSTTPRAAAFCKSLRPALVKKVADRRTLGARTLIAAREAFTDVNNDMVAVTGTAT